jgi:hypothetical protein
VLSINGKKIPDNVDKEDKCNFCIFDNKLFTIIAFISNVLLVTSSQKQILLTGKQSEDLLGRESPPSQGISASSSEQQHLFSSGPSTTTVTVTATITKITDDEVVVLHGETPLLLLFCRTTGCHPPRIQFSPKQFLKKAPARKRNMWSSSAYHLFMNRMDFFATHPFTP